MGGGASKPAQDAVVELPGGLWLQQQDSPAAADHMVQQSNSPEPIIQVGPAAACVPATVAAAAAAEGEQAQSPKAFFYAPRMSLELCSDELNSSIDLSTSLIMPSPAKAAVRKAPLKIPRSVPTPKQQLPAAMPRTVMR